MVSRLLAICWLLHGALASASSLPDAGPVDNGRREPKSYATLLDYQTLMHKMPITGQAGDTTVVASRKELFATHFSAQAQEPSTYLHEAFKPGPNDATALSYTTTQLRATSFYSYLLDPSHASFIEITPIPNELIAYKGYLQPYRKRSGSGNIGIDLKYAGLHVKWRGVQLDLYLANWVENTFVQRSQTHIIVRSLPSSIQSLLDQEELPFAGKTLQDAEAAADVLILEVGRFASATNNAVLVFDQGFWDKDAALWESVQKSDWQDVILNEEMKAAIQHEYRTFYASEKVYKDLGVSWKRGLIFLGPPGNGKTTSLRAIMKDVKLPLLYVRSFHTYAGDELGGYPLLGISMIFERARQEAPCLLIFEDLDSLITKQNRAFFLNQVDGIEDNDGLLLIGTTNHFDRLDPALSNRPSRFDRKYVFENPSLPERVSYALYWQDKLKTNPRIDFPDGLPQRVADQTEDFSFAYLKEAFVSALLTLAEDEKKQLSFPNVLMKQIDLLRKELHRDPESVKTARRRPSANGQLAFN